MYEIFGLYIALIGLFLANFAILYQMKSEISEIKIEFAACPYHGKANKTEKKTGVI